MSVPRLPPSPPFTPLTTGSDSASEAVDPSRIPLPESDVGAEFDKHDIADFRPAEIALPPSPPSAKPSLPLRQPRPRPRISNSAAHRIASESQIAPGRRVSGTLQHALQREREVSDTSSLDLAYYEQMREQAMDDEAEVEVDRPTWDSSLGFGGNIPGENKNGDNAAMGEAGADDEAWMVYVRQQLNTLFPDLVSSEDHTPGLDESGDGDISVSTIATSELPTPSLGALHANMPYGYPNPGMPNVREEIGGLRDDIARLRGLVLGLADGMRGQDPAQTTAERAEQPEAGPDEVCRRNLYLMTAS